LFLLILYFYLLMVDYPGIMRRFTMVEPTPKESFGKTQRTLDAFLLIDA